MMSNFHSLEFQNILRREKQTLYTIIHPERDVQIGSGGPNKTTTRAATGDGARRG
jgi:hypothetical protein